MRPFSVKRRRTVSHDTLSCAVSANRGVRQHFRISSAGEE